MKTFHKNIRLLSYILKSKTNLCCFCNLQNIHSKIIAFICLASQKVICISLTQGQHVYITIFFKSSKIYWGIGMGIEIVPRRQKGSQMGWRITIKSKKEACI